MFKYSCFSVGFFFFIAVTKYLAKSNLEEGFNLTHGSGDTVQRGRERLLAHILVESRDGDALSQLGLFPSLFSSG